MSILSKAFKPDNFESHKTPKLSYMNIWGSRSNFIVCESFLESKSPDNLVLCKINLDDTIDSGNFSVRPYLSLIQKDSGTLMHGLKVNMKEGLPFRTDFISRKLCRFLLMFLTCFTSLIALLLFPLMITFFLFVNIFWFYFIQHR